MSPFGLALCAAFIWGLAAFCEKKGLMGSDPLAGLVARNLGVFLGSAVLAFFVPGLPAKLAQAGGGPLAWLLAGGVLASVVGQVFFYRALKGGDIGQVTVVGGSWPLAAFLLGVVFLHEAVTPRKLLGVALVVLGVALLK